MTSWESNFNLSLQNPEAVFRDAELRRAKFECTPSGLPLCISGLFANVYQVRLPNGHLRAVRVFMRGDAERRERYEAVAAYLSGRRISCLVDFRQNKGDRESAGKSRKRVADESSARTKE